MILRHLHVTGGNGGIDLARQDTVDLCIDHAADIAPDAAMDMHGAAGRADLPVQAGHFKAGALDDGIAQHQNLGQHRQNQHNGDDGAPAQAVADGGDDGVGGHHGNQAAGSSQNGAGGEDGGEGGVQRLNNGLPGRILLFQLRIVAGDNNGVVDVSAHLNGVDNQIAQEVQRRILNGRHGEVQPDTALDDQDQQQNGDTQSCRCLQKDHAREALKLVDGTSVALLERNQKLRSSNTSGCTGVTYDKRTGKWMAYINFKKKRYLSYLILLILS